MGVPIGVEFGVELAAKLAYSHVSKGIDSMAKV